MHFQVMATIDLPEDGDYGPHRSALQRTERGAGK